MEKTLMNALPTIENTEEALNNTKPTTENTQMTQATTTINTDNTLKQAVSDNNPLEASIIEDKEQGVTIIDDNLVKLQAQEDERQEQVKKLYIEKKIHQEELERSQSSISELLGIEPPAIEKLPIGQCKVEQLLERVSVSFSKSKNGMYTEYFSLAGKVPLLKKGYNGKVSVRDKDASLARLKSMPVKDLNNILLAAQKAFVEKEALHQSASWKKQSETAKMARIAKVVKTMKQGEINGNR